MLTEVFEDRFEFGFEEAGEFLTLLADPDRSPPYALRAKATLVMAKLDRLARNVAFLSALMESGVEFVAVDQPHAN